MASAVLGNDKLEIKKSLFGLKTKIIYKPTQSPVRILKSECTSLTGTHIERLLNAEPDNLEDQVSALGRYHSIAVGQYILEALLSDDRQFAMLRLYHFQEMRFLPVTNAKVFEGKQAEIISRIF